MLIRPVYISKCATLQYTRPSWLNYIFSSIKEILNSEYLITVFHWINCIRFSNHVVACMLYILEGEVLKLYRQCLLSPPPKKMPCARARNPSLSSLSFSHPLCSLCMVARWL